MALTGGLTGVGLMALEFCTVKLVSTIILGEDGPRLGKTTSLGGSILENEVGFTVRVR